MHVCMWPGPLAAIVKIYDSELEHTEILGECQTGMLIYTYTNKR